MPKHPGPNDESILQMSYTQDESYDFHSPEARKPTPEHGQPQASNKCWKMLTFAGISSALNPCWSKILVTSCVIAVLFDPLFFYIPYTSEEHKCMGRDNGVQAAALVSRSVTDITFLVHIIYQLYVAIKFALSRVSEDENLILRYESVSREQMIQFAKAFSYQLSWRSFLTDVFSILPLPQLLIVGLFFDIGGNDYLLRRKIVSGILLVQYVPRIYRIYLSSVAITNSALWIRGVFNFFLYILASHVVGAFWYFFSIQRETSCWYQNCLASNRSESDCTFYCDEITTAALITPEFKTNLDKQCILKVPYDMTDPPFDFGIFFDALKNDIQGKINFPQKIGYCFWWGLRNLSNFGTSLTTSTHLWENSFAIFISIIGLLLFLYLIGNVQVYMERATSRAEDVREKLGSKMKDIEKWIENNGLENDMKKETMKNINEKLEKDINADLDDIYSLLLPYTRKVVKRFVGMRTLRNVPMLKEVDGRVLKMICDCLKPVKFQGNTMVFQMGVPFDRMVFITDGSMLTYTTATDQNTPSGQASSRRLATSSSTEAHFLKKGDAYGHMLLQFASASFTTLPISVDNVMCHTKVEAFVLMASDLKNIVTACGHMWPAFDYAASQDQAHG